MLIVLFFSCAVCLPSSAEIVRHLFAACKLCHYLPRPLVLISRRKLHESRCKYAHPRTFFNGRMALVGSFMATTERWFSFDFLPAPKSYGSCVHIYYLAHDFQLPQDSIDGNAQRLTPQSNSIAMWKKKEEERTSACFCRHQRRRDGGGIKRDHLTWHTSAKAPG